MEGHVWALVNDHAGMQEGLLQQNGVFMGQVDSEAMSISSCIQRENLQNKS